LIAADGISSGLVMIGTVVWVSIKAAVIFLAKARVVHGTAVVFDEIVNRVVSPIAAGLVSVNSSPGDGLVHRLGDGQDSALR
jgi:hypothetical protein